MISANEAVANGAEWLDKVNPGWEKKINLSTLNLADGCRCILGQVVVASVPEHMTEESYGDRLIKIPIASTGFFSLENGYSVVDMALRNDEFMYRHGFLAETGQGLRDLDEAWISLIKTRFETGALSDD